MARLMDAVARLRQFTCGVRAPYVCMVSSAPIQSLNFNFEGIAVHSFEIIYLGQPYTRARANHIFNSKHPKKMCVSPRCAFFVTHSLMVIYKSNDIN